LRGAVTLGAAIVVALTIAVLAAVGIYRQLDSSAALQRTLSHAEQTLDAVLRLQLQEDNGLRGYLATNDESYLSPYVTAVDSFDLGIAHLKEATAPLDIKELEAAFDEMRQLNREWIEQVARPLLEKPRSAATSRDLQKIGKVLSDQVQADATGVRALLDEREQKAQRDLKFHINQTLGIAVVAIVSFGAFAILFVGSRARMLARIDRERGITETLQGAFRTGWDEPAGTRIGTAYISATRDVSVGGDLFDVRRLAENRALLIVADVSGKGIEAAVNTAFVKYSIRALAIGDPDPAHILASFNRVFLDTIKNPSLFVVCFVGVLDLAAMRLEYASAGHAGAFLRRSGEVLQLDVTGPIVGLDPSFGYENRTLPLLPGDLLLLATDGLTEARDKAGRQLEDTGAMRLLRNGPRDPQACADALVAQVRTLTGGTVDDDLALLVLAIDGLPQAAARTRAR
jgi:CHASE3 domain sensor protein